MNKFKGIEDSSEKLPPKFARARDELGRFVKHEKPLGIIRKLLNDIASPVKFLGMRAALKDTWEFAKQVKEKASSTFTDLAANENKSFVEKMNEMNQYLGLSRRELSAFKSDIGQLAKDSNISMNSLASSLLALADAGVHSADLLKELGPGVTDMAGATNASVGTLANLAYRLNNAYDFSGTQIAGVFAHIKMIAQSTAADAGELTTQMEGHIKTMGNVLAKESAAGAAAIIGNLASVSGALADDWGDAGGMMADMMASALSGDTEAIKTLQGFGIEYETLQDKLRSGDLGGLFSEMSAKIKASANDPIELKALAGSIGFTGDMATFASIGEKGGAIDKTIRRLGAALNANTDFTKSAEDVHEGNVANRTIFEQLQIVVANAVGAFDEFGISGVDVFNAMNELNPVLLLSLAHIGKLGLKAAWTTTKFVALAAVSGAKALGGLMGMRGPKKGGMFSKIGGFFGKKGGKKGGMFSKIGGFFGKIGGKSALPSKAEGGGIQGVLEGIGKGLKGFGKALSVFGKAMIGPGGLGLLALTALLIGVGFAIKLAAPLFVMIADVVKTVVGGMVDIFKSLAGMEPAKLKAIGPALVVLGLGLGALGAGTIVYGASLLLAAAGIKVFKMVSGSKGSIGSGISGVIEDLIGGFAPLRKKQSELKAVNTVMKMVVSFISDFAKTAAILAGLSVGSMIGNAVGSILSFFGVKSPMEQLAEHGRDMAQTINSLVEGFAAVLVGKSELSMVSQTLRDFIGFLTEYAQLQKAVDALPGIGVFQNMGDALRGFFGGKSGIERVLAESLPLMQRMQGVLATFTGLQVAAGMAGVTTGTTGSNLRQRSAESSVVPDQIHAIIEAVIRRADESPIHRDIMTSNILLGQILLALRNQPKPAPVLMQAPTLTQGRSNFSTSLGGDGI